MPYEVVEDIKDFGLALQYPVGTEIGDDELPEPLVESLLDAGVIEVAKPKPKAKSKKKEE